MSTYRGPWAAAAEDPIDWALRTGRITDKSSPQWRAMYGGDPDGVGRTLAGLYPVLATNKARVTALEEQAERRLRREEDELFARVYGPAPDDASALFGPDGENFDHLFPPR